MQLPDRLRSTLRGRGPVVLTLVAALISGSALAYGPGALTSRANAQAAGTVRPPATAPSTPVADTRPASRVPGSSGRLQIIGHRAGLDWGPPNTLSTISHAIGLGADAIEFDVHFTADQHAVVFHDGTLEPTTNCKGSIADIKFRDLTKCRVGINEHVPTLDAVLARLASSPVYAYVHVKAADTAAQARQIMAAIDRQHLNDPARLTVIASNSALLDRMHDAGAKRLGLVFDNAAGWHTPYKVLVVFGTQVTPALVAQAQRRGHFVIVVQDHPTPLAGMAALHADGFMANGLADALRELANVPAPLSDNRAPTEPQAHRAPTGHGSRSGRGTDDA